MIDRNGQSVDIAGDSSSESEIDADTGRDMIDPRAQDTSAHVDNSSESDLDIGLEDKDQHIDPNDKLATDAPTTQRVQTKGLAKDKLRQKKLKQKVLKNCWSFVFYVPLTTRPWAQDHRARHYSLVGSDVAWESRGTSIDSCVRHIFS